jgi:DNA-binding NarL/FixJ family response regulator
MSAKKVVIVEDHTLVREGLRALLEADSELELVGEASDGQEVVRRIHEWKPDLVLIDLSMPGITGIDAIREVKRRAPEVRFVVLTVHDNEEYVLDSLEAGANGYVLKTATHQELLAAVHDVLRGHTHLCPSVQQKVVAAYLDRTRTSRQRSSWESVTPRERQILKLVAEGHTNKEMASYLCLSVKTIETHRSSLMKKLNLHKVSMLTAFAIEKHLVM